MAYSSPLMVSTTSLNPTSIGMIACENAVNANIGVNANAAANLNAIAQATIVYKYGAALVAAVVIALWLWKSAAVYPHNYTALSDK